jgi:hypothetical protein
VTRTRFDPEAFRDLWTKVSRQKATYEWPFDSCVLDRFRPESSQPMRKPAGRDRMGAVLVARI